MNDMAGTTVYMLCMFTSVACAALLFRTWLRTRAALILWTALSFVCLAANNLLLVADLVFLPDIDLRLPRELAGLAAVCVLLYGFIRET